MFIQLSVIHCMIHIYTLLHYSVDTIHLSKGDLFIYLFFGGRGTFTIWHHFLDAFLCYFIIWGQFIIHADILPDSFPMPTQQPVIDDLSVT